MDWTVNRWTKLTILLISKNLAYLASKIASFWKKIFYFYSHKINCQIYTPDVIFQNCSGAGWCWHVSCRVLYVKAVLTLNKPTEKKSFPFFAIYPLCWAPCVKRWRKKQDFQLLGTCAHSIWSRCQTNSTLFISPLWRLEIQNAHAHVNMSQLECACPFSTPPSHFHLFLSFSPPFLRSQCCRWLQSLAGWSRW